MRQSMSRRTFLSAGAVTAGAMTLAAADQTPDIEGFDDTETTTRTDVAWEPISDRKIRVGIAGYGVCQFGAAFGFQDHPNVEVVAVSDLIPERCEGLAKACRCDKTYPSLEEMVKDDAIEAIFVATDAPSHMQHCIEALNHGKHVASAVPAVFGSLEQADTLYDAVKRSGLNYMMFETSAFHNESYAMRKVYDAGYFGQLIYSEGEYYHYSNTQTDSYKGWRIGLPPQWYPTHSNAYYTCITGGSFTEVSCMGIPTIVPHRVEAVDHYGNPFGSEIALFRTSDGGMARMAVSWDTPGFYAEAGRVRGQRGSMRGIQYDGLDDISELNLNKPPLPPGMNAGGHGGSHGYLTEEFITSIIEERTPLVNIAWALNMTVAGIVAHESALKDGELMKIPQYTW